MTRSKQVICLTMLLLTAACAATWAEELEPVDLKMMLLMDAEPDAPLVHAKFSEQAKKDLNATVKIEHTGTADWQTKYRLMLTSGEEIDVAFSARWAFYPELARDGAFLALDDLLPKYAPKTWAEMDKMAWEHSKIDGHIYMVPKNDTDFPNHGFMYRLDWAEKYGIGQLKTVDDLWKYFEGVKANENVIPYNTEVGHFHYMFNMLDLLGWDYQPYRAMLGAAQSPLIIGDIDEPDKAPIVLWEHPKFKELLKYSRDGYEKGFWPKNVLANKNPIRDAFEKGVSGATWVNPKQANETWMKVKAAFPDATWDDLDCTANYPIWERKSVAVAGMSVPANAPNPERAVMLIEKLHQDATYNRMLTYGLEGTHWALNANGNIVMPEGVTAEKSGWQWDKPNPWGFRNDKFFLTDPLKLPETWSIVKEAWQKYTNNYMFDPFYTFAFDKTPVSSEMAACGNVVEQYFLPLIWGVVDPETGYAEFVEKMNQAGWPTVKAEFDAQWTAYKEAQK